MYVRDYLLHKTLEFCQNKNSRCYLSQCFVASHCPLKVKEKDAGPPATQKAATPEPKKAPISKIKCTLPKGCQMYSRTFGQGKYVDYNEKSMVISVQFENDKIVRFLYPSAILDKHLTVPESALESVIYDVCHAERG